MTNVASPNLGHTVCGCECVFREFIVLLLFLASAYFPLFPPLCCRSASGCAALLVARTSRPVLLLSCRCFRCSCDALLSGGCCVWISWLVATSRLPHIGSWLSVVFRCESPVSCRCSASLVVSLFVCSLTNAGLGHYLLTERNNCLWMRTLRSKKEEHIPK